MNKFIFIGKGSQGKTLRLSPLTIQLLKQRQREQSEHKTTTRTVKRIAQKDDATVARASVTSEGNPKDSQRSEAK